MIHKNGKLSTDRENTGAQY